MVVMAMSRMRLMHLRCAPPALHTSISSRACFSSTSLPLSTQFDAEPTQLSAVGQPHRVVFGAKAAATQVGAIARASGIRKMLVVRDRDSGAASRTQYVEFLLMQAGIPCFQYTLKRDCATAQDVDDGVATAKRVGADGVLAFGGGSAMDLTRAIALVLANNEPTESYMKGSIKADDLERAVPHLIVPTISGSGAEMATQALVLEEEEEVKQPLVADAVISAEAVIIDPMLALSVPLHATVQGALTALGQCIESYLLGCESEADEALALQGIELVAQAFAKPLVEGKVDLKSVAFREPLALSSLTSGIVANVTGVGASHAIAVSLGGVSDLPHCQVTTTFLPLVLDQYAALAEENEGDAFFDELKVKLDEVADRLTVQSGFQGASVAAWLRYVAQRFALPDVTSLALEDALVDGLVDRAVQRQEEVSSAGNVESILEKEDIRSIVERAVVLGEGTKKEK